MEQFNQEGLCALSMDEMGMIEGGDWFKVARQFIKSTPGAVLVGIVLTSWDDIKDGLKDGWEAGGK